MVSIPLFALVNSEQDSETDWLKECKSVSIALESEVNDLVR